LRPQTLIILCLGLLANCLDTACGVCFGKVMRVMSGGKINPLIGAAGISAFPMAARVAQKEGQKYKTETKTFIARISTVSCALRGLRFKE